MTDTSRVAPRPRGALRIDEAADYLGVSRSYVERSDIPRVRLGRRVVFRIVDLDRYLAQRCDGAHLEAAS